jgi:hypothetical protein
VKSSPEYKRVQRLIAENKDEQEINTAVLQSGILTLEFAENLVDQFQNYKAEKVRKELLKGTHTHIQTEELRSEEEPKDQQPVQKKKKLTINPFRKW